MKTFSQYITELFDKPYPFKLKGKDVLFTTGEFLRYVTEIRLPDKTLLKIEISNMGSNHWDLDFKRDGVFSKTGQGDQMKVFATVIAVLKEFIKLKSPRRITFTAEKENHKQTNDSSRERLYNTLAKKFANEFGYSLRLTRSVIGTLFSLEKK